MPDRFRRGIINVIILLISGAIGLLICEGLVRRFVRHERPLSALLRNLYVPHEQRGYALKPGFHRHIKTRQFDSQININAMGLREPPIASKQPQMRRVIVLGDSFTFGVHAGPPESTFVKTLERAVQQRLTQRQRRIRAANPQTGRRVEFINAGVEGYGTAQEFLLLQELAPDLLPDAVLLAFYLGNDFTDNSARTQMAVVDGYLMLAASAEPYKEYARPLHRKLRLALHAHSELYLFLKQRWKRPASPDFAAAAAEDSTTVQHVPDYFAFDAGFAASMRQQSSAIMCDAIRETREIFTLLRDWCAERNVRLLIVAIPARQQVDRDDRIRWLEQFDLEEASFDFRLPNERLRKLAAEANIPLVDLTDAFTTRTAAGEELHVENDRHWNVQGHDLAARSLVEPALHYLVEPTAVIGSR